MPKEGKVNTAIKTITIRVTDPIAKYGGMVAGFLYLPQTYNIFMHPEVAVGISLITFGFLNVLQLSVGINSLLKGNTPVAVGMLTGLIGSASVTFITIWMRLLH